MDSNEYPAMANWGGWRSEQDSSGAWAMKQWTDMNTGGLNMNEFRPYTATDIELMQAEYERRGRQMQYSQLKDMYQQVIKDPEKELLELVHTRGKFYKMLLLQELSIA